MDEKDPKWEEDIHVEDEENNVFAETFASDSD